MLAKYIAGPEIGPMELTIVAAIGLLLVAAPVAIVAFSIWFARKAPKAKCRPSRPEQVGREDSPRDGAS
jgi:hypothetical protein